MEVEKDKMLPFLGALVVKNRDGTLGHAVYKNAVHTNTYTLTYTTIVRTEVLADEIHKKQ